MSYFQAYQVFNQRCPTSGVVDRVQAVGLSLSCFFLFGARDLLAPMRAVLGVDLETGVSEVVENILVVQSAHLDNVDTGNGLSLDKDDGGTVLAIVVCDVLAAVTLACKCL